MAQELTLNVLRLGFLAVLWLFVLTAVSVMRSDMFGPRPVRGQDRPARPQTPRRERPVPGGPAPTGAGRGGRAVAGNAPTRLVVTAGSLAGTVVTLGSQPVTLGRAHDSTLVLDDDYASSRHARFFPGPDGRWLVEDLGSTNGTYLDRTRLTGPTPVPLGAPIRIGKTVLELRK